MTATVSSSTICSGKAGYISRLDVPVVVKLSLAAFGAWRGAAENALANHSPLVLNLEPPASWCKADAA